MQQGIKLRLTIAGEGRKRPELEKLVHSLGMKKHVTLPGHIDDTPAFLNSLDLFVLSSDSEAHPNALSEAMACGLPCIASRVGGFLKSSIKEEQLYYSIGVTKTHWPDSSPNWRMIRISETSWAKQHDDSPSSNTPCKPCWGVISKCTEHCHSRQPK